MSGVSSDLQRAVAAVARLEAADPAQLNQYLRARLERLLGHAFTTTPYYRRVLARAGWRPGSVLTPERWRRIALLEREVLQEQGAELEAARLPDECGTAHWVHSSGSTGTPIRVRATHQQSGLWDAITVCEHLEHGRDFAGRLAVIRVTHGGHGPPPEGSDFPDWGVPVNLLYPSGPSALLSIDADSQQQARWLARRDPHYLLTYPSNLQALLDALDAGGLALPSLRQVRSVNEALGEDVRARCREQLGVELVDVYSASEIGYIATQSADPRRADRERYRCRNETVLVEVLDDDGMPAAPGEAGRVVVTALYSFAMPLIRYAIGDMAVAADRSLWCGAPRHLERVMGRWRNLMQLPGGRRRWPRLGLRRMNEIVRLRQVQAIQTGLDSLLLKVVCSEPLTAAQHAALQHHLCGRFDNIEQVTVEQVETIPRGSGGKFEEFRCEV